LSAISFSLHWAFERVTIAPPTCYFQKFEVAKNRPEQALELVLDHVAIAVPSISAVLPLLELVSGARSSPIERLESQNVDVAFVGSAATRIELLQPITADSTVQRFLDKRGPGLHHIAYRVPDIEAALERLAAAGIRLIDEKPRPGAGGHRIAFLHPQSTGDVLIELVEG
jgi:methylmalonyl-CoA epimerase